MPTHVYITSNQGIWHYLLTDEPLLVFQDLCEVPNPMYLQLEGDRMDCVLLRPFSENDHSGAMQLHVEKDGRLTPDQEVLDTMGVEGCHLCRYKDKVYVANYTSGSLCRVPDVFIRHEGKSVNPVRQEKAHAHFILPTPDGQYLCACDLGMDEVLTYDQNLKLVDVCRIPAGSGPRHIAFSDDGHYAFVACELDSTVAVLTYDHGHFGYSHSVDGIPIEERGHSHASAIRYQDGYVYMSNRGYNTVSEFKHEGDKLTLVRHLPTNGAARDFILWEGLLIAANESGKSTSLVDLKSGKTLQILENLGSAGCVVAQKRKKV